MPIRSAEFTAMSERVFINQGCTFLDYAGIRLGDRTMVGPKASVRRSW